MFRYRRALPDLLVRVGLGGLDARLCPLDGRHATAFFYSLFYMRFLLPLLLHFLPPPSQPPRQLDRPRSRRRARRHPSHENNKRPQPESSPASVRSAVRIVHQSCEDGADDGGDAADDSAGPSQRGEEERRRGGEEGRDAQVAEDGTGLVVGLTCGEKLGRDAGVRREDGPAISTQAGNQLEVKPPPCVQLVRTFLHDEERGGKRTIRPMRTAKPITLGSVSATRRRAKMQMVQTEPETACTRV